MAGVIDFDLRKIKALLFDIDGVLSANVVSIDLEGVPMRTVNIKDGYALHRAAQLGVNMGIISGGTCESVRLRYEKLGLKPENIVLGAARKIVCYEVYKQRFGLQDNEILFVGDDIPDMEIMMVCGLPCCPADAAPPSSDTRIVPQAACPSVAPFIMRTCTSDRMQKNDQLYNSP